MEFVKKKSTLASNMAFFVSTQETFTNQDNVLKGVNIYGITQEYRTIHAFNIGFGRFFLMNLISTEGGLLLLLDLK